ncbi:hypothetical protein D3C71_1808880 [compost metagenome]
MTLLIAFPDHVVVGDVHVDGLHRQLRHQWLQSPFGALRGLGDQPSLPLVGNYWQQVLDQRTGVPGIPLQGTLKARMVETRQGQVHFAAEPTEAGDNVMAKVVEMGQGLTFDVVKQAHMY